MTSALRGSASWGVAVLLLVPFVPLVLWAVADRWSFPAVLPQAWGLEGWSDAVGGGLGAALLRSSALGAAVAAVATPLGALAGRALGWDLVRRQALVSVVLLTPVALPPLAVAMGLDVVLLRLRIPDTLAVVVLLSVFALPYTTFVLRSAHVGLDPEVEDQARVLGATAWQAWVRVTGPALRRSLGVATLLAFLVGWSDYAVTVVIGGGQLVTAPVLLASAAAGTGNEPVVAAVAVASVAPPLVMTLLLVRLRRGIAPGGDR